MICVWFSIEISTVSLIWQQLISLITRERVPLLVRHILKVLFRTTSLSLYYYAFTSEENMMDALWVGGGGGGGAEDQLWHWLTEVLRRGAGDGGCTENQLWYFDRLKCWMGWGGWGRGAQKISCDTLIDSSVCVCVGGGGGDILQKNQLWHWLKSSVHRQSRTLCLGGSIEGLCAQSSLQALTCSLPHLHFLWKLTKHWLAAYHTPLSVKIDKTLTCSLPQIHSLWKLTKYQLAAYTTSTLCENQQNTDLQSTPPPLSVKIDKTLTCSLPHLHSLKIDTDLQPTQNSLSVKTDKAPTCSLAHLQSPWKLTKAVCFPLVKEGTGSWDWLRCNNHGRDVRLCRPQSLLGMCT